MLSPAAERPMGDRRGFSFPKELHGVLEGTTDTQTHYFSFPRALPAPVCLGGHSLDLVPLPEVHMPLDVPGPVGDGEASPQHPPAQAANDRRLFFLRASVPSGKGPEDYFMCPLGNLYAPRFRRRSTVFPITRFPMLHFQGLLGCKIISDKFDLSSEVP